MERIHAYIILYKDELHRFKLEEVWFIMINKGWLAFFATLILIGILGISAIITKGHGVYGTTDYVPWGILISTYVFFVVTSTGLCLISSLGHVFGIQPFAMIAKRAVMLAIITLLAGFAVIGLEVGNPLKFIYIVLSPNFSSPIFWMGAMYSLYLVLMLAEFYYLSIDDHQKSRFIGLTAFAVAIIAHSNLGAVFGFLHARPFWEGPYLPIYFIVSALLSGTAILIVMFYLKERGSEESPIIPALSKLLMLFIGISIFFSVWKILSGVYGHPHGKYEAVQALFNGPLSWSFWTFEVGLGMVAPVVILLLNRGRTALFAASSLILIAIFFMRFNLIVAGQIVPLEMIDTVAAAGVYHSYRPSWAELAIVAGAFGFTGFTYLLSEEKMDLDEEEQDSIPFTATHGKYEG